MKKFVIFFFLFISIAYSLVAVSVESTSEIEGGQSLSVGADMSITITPEDVFYYSIGFSNKTSIDEVVVDDEDILPEPFEGTLHLKYDPLNSIAYNAEPVYLYYKVKTSDSFDITLTLNGNMKSQFSSDLGWNVHIESVPNLKNEGAEFQCDRIDSSKTTSTTASVKNKEIGLRYGSYLLSVKTDVVPLMDKKTNFSGSMTLAITSAD